jgi:hypothetical protein
MLRKSIPCMAAGLLFAAGLFLFMADYIFPEWQPGWPGLIFWTAISFLIIGGTWLWDEVHEVWRGSRTVPLFPNKQGAAQEIDGARKSLSEVEQPQPTPSA